MKKWWIIAIILIIVVASLLIYKLKFVEIKKDTQEESEKLIQVSENKQEAITGKTSFVLVKDQNLTDNKIVIEKIYFDKPGFVVLYNQDRNKMFISDLIEGEKLNYKMNMKLNNTERISLEMRYDNDNKKFDKDDVKIPEQEQRFTIFVEKIGPPDSFKDSFEGSTINDKKYLKAITGNGTIMQDNKIIMAGSGTDVIIWNILYSRGNVDFTRDFSIKTDGELTKLSSVNGDIMMMIGVENRSLLQKPAHSKGAYCEISIGSHGTFIRMENTDGYANNGESISKTKGNVIFSYDSKNKLLTCGIDETKITLSQPSKTGDYALTLRSGLHEISHEHNSELKGSGSFNVMFDNLEFKA